MPPARGKTAAKVEASARGLRVLALRSAFNQPVVEGLAAGARAAFLELEGRPTDWFELEVPGAFELPLAARTAALTRRYDAIVALGAVIKGDTDHYEHVARAATEGLLQAGLDTGVPVAFGVLTVRTAAQALERAAPGPENKGGEATRAGVGLARLLARLRHRSRTPRRLVARRTPQGAR